MQQNTIGAFNSFLINWSGQKSSVQLHVALPKWLINQFKPVQRNRKHKLRAYCSNINTVSQAVGLYVGIMNCQLGDWLTLS